MKRLSLRALMGIFLAVFVARLVTTLPLAVLLALSDDRVLRYGATAGSIWDGTIEGLVINDYHLGRVHVGVDPWSLLTARVTADWRADAPGSASQGRIAFTPWSQRVVVSDAAARIEVPQAGIIMPIDVAGTLTLRLDRVEVGQGGCRLARGAVRTDILTDSFAEVGWQGPELAGDVACQADDLVLRLNGANAGEVVRFDARLSPAGRYDMRAQIDSGDARLALALPGAGFEPRNGSYILTRSGRVPGL